MTPSTLSPTLRTPLAVLLLATVPATSTAAAPPEVPAVLEQVTPGALQLVPTAPWGWAHLVVNGPGGLRLEKRFDAGSAIEFTGFGPDGARLPDGVYRWELRIAPPLSDRERAEPATEAIDTGPATGAVGARVAWGEFQVREATLEPFAPPEDERRGEVRRPAAPEEEGDGGRGAIARKTVENHFTTDLGTAAQICAGCSSTFEPQNEPLTLIGTEPGIRFQEAESSPTRLWEVDVTTSNRFVIEDSTGADIVNVEAGAPANSLYVGSGGTVGVGTSTPNHLVNLHVVDNGVAVLLMETTFPEDSEWSLVASHLAFELFDQISNEVPLSIAFGAPYYTLRLTSTGRVGIGHFAPDAKLHVAGNAIVDGDVALGSSRTLKHDLAPVAGAEVLAAVRELPLYHWRYRDDDVQARHLGPMAEDVHAAFGLGRDDKHLSPADSAGLALGAIQGVDAEVRGLRQATEALERENRELKERLEALERRLEELAAAPRQTPPAR